MQKSRSLTLSEKQRNKIIDIIHSKITPLKFKHRSPKNDLKQMTKSKHAILNKKNQEDPNIINKRISISTYMEKNKPKIKNQPRKSGKDFRNQVLNTYNLLKEQKFLTGLMNNATNQNKTHVRAVSQFAKFANPFPAQNHEKILPDIMLLQKKKILKNIKSQICFKKNQLFAQIQNKKIQQKQEQALHKKYFQNSRQILKQKYQQKNMNSLKSSIQNSKQGISQKEVNKNQRHSRQVSIAHLQSKENNTQNKALNNQQTQKISNIALLRKQNQEQSNKIKQYLRYFKKQARQNPTQTEEHQSQSKLLINNHLISTKKNQQQYSNFWGQNQYFGDSNYGGSQNQICNTKQKDKKFQKEIFKMLEQKQNDFNSQNQNLQAQLMNAKIRIKLNHKKLVGIGKTQSFQPLG